MGQRDLFEHFGRPNLAQSLNRLPTQQDYQHPFAKYSRCLEILYRETIRVLIHSVSLAGRETHVVRRSAILKGRTPGNLYGTAITVAYFSVENSRHDGGTAG